MVALKLLLAIATIGLAQPTQAAPAPIVFDFEDGLQGWTLGGAAQRVQTQVLGGEWAVLSEGGAIPPRPLDVIEDVVFVVLGTYIFLPIDITDIASVSIEQHFVAGDEDGLVLIRGFEITTNVVAGNVIPFVPESPGNPSLRTADVSSLLGGGIYISWADVSSNPSPLINSELTATRWHD